jgi:hypothetical protein
MGWDAYAIDPETDESVERRLHLWAFRRAAKRVQRRARTVDGMLRMGGLGCSVCADALRRGAFIDPWGANLTPEQVKASVSYADWNAVALPWARESARAFLETCARFRLGVRFSW